MLEPRREGAAVRSLRAVGTWYCRTLDKDCRTLEKDMSRSEPPPISQDLVRRVARVRYLHDLGLGQSKHPEPLSSVAVLMLHDAVELFLQIVAEHWGATLKKNTEFMAYWGAL